MFPIVRMFDSGPKAREVAEDLRNAERLDTLENRPFKPFAPHVLDPAGSSDGNRSAVRRAVDEGILPGALAKAALEGLDRGRTVVVVRCSFGSSAEAIEKLEGAGAVDTDLIPAVVPGETGLLSEFLGIPLLTKSRTPLSDFFGVPTLSEGTVLGGKVNDFSLSRMLGMPELTKGPGAWSFGMPLLSRGRTPLSSMFGLPTLTKGSGETSMGFPTLARDNPTPLSSALGLPLLTKEEGAKAKEKT